MKNLLWPLGSLVFVPLPHVGLVLFPLACPTPGAEAWRLTQAGPWFLSIRTVQTVRQGPVFADYKNKLSGKAGKTLSCFLRVWEEDGGGSPEEGLPNRIQSVIFPACCHEVVGLPEATPWS